MSDETTNVFNTMQNCDHCEFSSSSKKVMYHHYHREHDPMAYKCEQCSYASPRKAEYQRHFRNKHAADIWRESCTKEGCTYTTPDRYRMSLHAKYHEKNLTVYNCDVCAFKSTREACVTRHKKRKHEKRREYVCDFRDCTYRGFLPQSVRDHFEKAHRWTYKKCPKCPFETIKPGELATHLIRRHPEFQVPSTHAAYANAIRANVQQQQQDVDLLPIVNTTFGEFRGSVTVKREEMEVDGLEEEEVGNTFVPQEGEEEGNTFAPQEEDSFTVKEEWPIEEPLQMEQVVLTLEIEKEEPQEVVEEDGRDRDPSLFERYNLADEFYQSAPTFVILEQRDVRDVNIQYL